MNNLKDRLKMIFTAVLCFLMSMIPGRNGKLSMKNNAKKEGQAVTCISENVNMYNRNVREEKEKKIDVIPKRRVYWHEPVIKRKGSLLEYEASG